MKIYRVLICLFLIIFSYIFAPSALSEWFNAYGQSIIFYNRYIILKNGGYCNTLKHFLLKFNAVFIITRKRCGVGAPVRRPFNLYAPVFSYLKKFLTKSTGLTPPKADWSKVMTGVSANERVAAFL